MMNRKRGVSPAGKMGKIIAAAELFLGVAAFIYYFICVAAAGPDVSILYIWPLLGAVLMAKGTACLLRTVQQFRTVQRRRAVRIGILLFDAVFVSGLFSTLVFSGFVLHSMASRPAANCAYVVVLGAKVQGTAPSEMLQRRIDAAYGYLLENENAIAVGTGGQGADEEISEGVCIAETLKSMGIPQERILFEGKSATTVENIRFALQAIPDDPQCITVVSSGFHLFRAKLILRNFTDAEIYGISASGGGLLTPHYILREYIVLMIDLLLGNYRLFPYGLSENSKF